MKCWICGDEADSREHLVKASDLRLFYGEISPKKPVFLHTEDMRNIPLHSAKTNKIKTENKVLCRRCNDTRTAPYDESWSVLLKYLHSNWKLVKSNKRIRLQRVFPGRVKRNSLNIHLYFVKLFGCRIVDSQMPIDISCLKD